jgi:hypothetical protein
MLRMSNQHFFFNECGFFTDLDVSIDDDFRLPLLDLLDKFKLILELCLPKYFECVSLQMIFKTR